MLAAGRRRWLGLGRRWRTIRPGRRSSRRSQCKATLLLRTTHTHAAPAPAPLTTSVHLHLSYYMHAHRPGQPGPIFLGRARLSLRACIFSPINCRAGLGSHFTGPNCPALAPPRLLLATECLRLLPPSPVQVARRPGWPRVRRFLLVCSSTRSPPSRPPPGRPSSLGPLFWCAHLIFEYVLSF